MISAQSKRSAFQTNIAPLWLDVSYCPRWPTTRSSEASSRFPGSRCWRLFRRGAHQGISGISSASTTSSLPTRYPLCRTARALYDSTFALLARCYRLTTYENHYNKESDRAAPLLLALRDDGCLEIGSHNTSAWTAEERSDVRRDL